jgi:hypothetical protein
MNERIKQLAEQAMVEKKNVPCKGIDGWTTLETVRQVDPEKFAELIVRECCDIVHRKTDESIRVVMAIEQHFGVEE